MSTYQHVVHSMVSGPSGVPSVFPGVEHHLLSRSSSILLRQSQWSSYFLMYASGNFLLCILCISYALWMLMLLSLLGCLHYLCPLFSRILIPSHDGWSSSRARQPKFQLNKRPIPNAQQTDQENRNWPDMVSRIIEIVSN